MSVNRHVATELSAAGGRAIITLPGTTEDRPWHMSARRSLPVSPETVWMWLTDPIHLAAWSPIVPDAPFTAPGARTSRENSEDEPVDATVIECSRPKKLVHNWGPDLLSWVLVGMSGRESDQPFAWLTLTHETHTAEDAASAAAGWDICLAVLATMVRQGFDPRVRMRNKPANPLQRVVGEDALEYGWQDLRDQYYSRIAAR